MSYVGTNGGNRTLSQALPNWKWAFVPQIGLHTTEFPAGHTLLALFQFLNTRNTHGSYHAAADTHGSSGQYCPWSWGAWHAPSINRWSAGIAGNVQANSWDRLSTTARRNVINGMALQAHRYSRWCVSRGLGPVPARRLTKAQAVRREAGFVYHGSLQADRSDPTGPRNIFPWDEFIAEFRRLESGDTEVKEGIVMDPKEVWQHKDAQNAGRDSGRSKSFQLSLAAQRAETASAAAQRAERRAEAAERNSAAVLAAVEALAENQDKSKEDLVNAVKEAAREGFASVQAIDVAESLEIRPVTDEDDQDD